jgi:hypothetical protein
MGGGGGGEVGLFLQLSIRYEIAHPISIWSVIYISTCLYFYHTFVVEGGASYAVLEALGERAVLEVSPIILMKAKKNKVETAGKVHWHSYNL